ncbi:MAG: FMN-binding negative transcriptional regulator [Thermomicrobiales bacterium]|nr:FMN-binding negative transcriptional regulator [Thermomicrobiales bacterium]
MYHSDRYPTSLAEAEAFVATQRHGYLIATPPGAHPQVSILPFVKQGDNIELHCVQEDPTFAAVRANPLVTFFVADFLAFSRHDWVDPNDGARATLNFRAVAYHCRAETSTAPSDVAAALARLLAAYEPGATYEPIANGDFYGPRIERLAAVYLHVLSTDAKFKVGPAGSAAVKRQVVAGLRERNEPGDARAADEIAATLLNER